MNQVVTQVLDTFETFRQLSSGVDQYQEVGRPSLEARIIPMVERNMPLKFAILGFPFKSTNTRDKVLSRYPDLGESLTLQNFSRMNDLIKQVYPPGMSLSILSDGYVFNDLLDIHEFVTTEYLDISMRLGRMVSAPVEWYNLKDFYSKHLSLDQMREKLDSQFGISPDDLQKRILFDADVNYLYRSMILYTTEETALMSFPSNKGRERFVKSLVRKMMLRNESYDNMVRHVFKDHIRLSMHKSVNNGKKYSIKLIDSPLAKYSPWNSAVVMNGSTVMTMHKKDAIDKGYELVNVDDQPYYFTTK